MEDKKLFILKHESLYNKITQSVGDVIKQKSNKELSTFLAGLISDCTKCPLGPVCNRLPDSSCADQLLVWLDSAAREKRSAPLVIDEDQARKKSPWKCEYTDKECPECGELQIIMTNQDTGRWFIGCAAYPKCKWHHYPHQYTGSAHRVDIDEWGDIDELEDNFPGIHGSELGVSWINIMP